MESKNNNRLYLVIKKHVDILVALLLLISLIILLPLVAILMKFDSKGPIFHVSRRVGKHNEEFKMYKLRSMLTESPKDIASDKLNNADAYITTVGKWLRKSNFDELPQAINILKGNMSLIGPRPAAVTQHELTKQRTAEGVHRLKPGITGWAQVNGRDNITDDKKVELDKYYLVNKSLVLDMKILLMTICAIIKFKDIKH